MDAKIHKIEMYVVDVNNCFENAESILDLLEDKTDLFYKKKESKTIEFNWNDNLKINRVDAGVEDYEEFFI